MKESTQAKPVECDVCVIGTGAGGGVMIQELTRAGFEVVALERGPFLQTSDFEDDELAALVRNEVFAKDQLETYRATDVSPAVSGRFNELAHCVGGALTRWGGAAWRYRRDDFRVLATEGALAGASLADWPIEMGELEPFYKRAEEDFGVVRTPHPGRVGTAAFARAAKALGYVPATVPLAINSKPQGGRSACLDRGACSGFGCPTHARASTLSVSLPVALSTGKLDLRPNSMVFSIDVDGEGRAHRVRYFDWKGREAEVRARHVVLAGNAIGSAHLLLLSGIANSSGLVGKNLTYQMRAAVGFLLDRPTLGFTGVESHAAIEQFQRSDRRRGFIRGGLVAEENGVNARPITYATKGAAGHPSLGRPWGTALKRFLSTFPRAVFVGAVLEDLPVESNAVDLDPTVKDRHGLAVPRLTHRQHANDLAMHRWFRTKLLEIADAAGATESWVSEIPGVTAIDAETSMRGSRQPLGTCRMGTDRGTSVVDRWCRSHDVQNLWIVDGSVFPTAGGYPPALTILANAYRVAKYFVHEAQRRNL